MKNQAFDLIHDWASEASHLLLNPRLEHQEHQTQVQLFNQFAENFPAHVWLNSSGSSKSANQSLKLIALSKKAILNSAMAVNAHLSTTSDDRWLCPLPIFHVGGLGIYARGFLSGSQVFDLRGAWSVDFFLDQLQVQQITLASMVPTQVFDIVRAKKTAPKFLRAVVVGGSALDEKLYFQARALGWPLLPSYGMTETASQIATADLASLSQTHFPSSVPLLSHAQVSISNEGFIEVRGSSLLTGVAQQVDGESLWTSYEGRSFSTQDRGQFNQGQLSVFGRDSDFVKILGEGVDLSGLEARSRDFFHLSSLVVVAVPESRRGFDLILVVEESADLVPAQIDLNIWNQSCLPVERLKELIWVKSIPRTSLGKVNKAQLLSQISSGLV